MEVRNPHIVVLAGPNGAGKSTVAPFLLRGTLQVREFVNADVIARGISGFEPHGAAIQAGRVMLSRLKRLAESRVDFAFETTLAGRGFARWIAGLVSTGYAFSLVFLWLPSPEAAAARVRGRVEAGGHSVPEETIRRRYAAGLRNFFQVYQPLATRWRFYDNGCQQGPRLLARGRGEIATRIMDSRLWSEIEVEYGHG